jgi:uncharacterized protein (DUF1800 family)
MDIGRLDPDWAWAAYQPSADVPWDRRAAAHLYRRAGFAATPAQLNAAIKLDPLQLIHQLVNGRSEDQDFLQLMQAMVDSMIATGNADNLAPAWLYRMAETEDQVREKVTLFWHGHFATGAEKVEDPVLMQAQNDMLRSHALGSFRSMVQGISRDAAMLVYLDSVSNRKTHPNENYARELMELFCLGEGQYTETDIRELARCFTGWEIKNRQFRFNRYQHDFGSKTILGATEEFSGEQAIDLVLSQPAAAEFLVTKMVRFFLFDEPRAPRPLIEPLIKQLRDDDFQLAGTIERMLSSNIFFSPLARARKIRSPVELVVGLLRCLEISTDMNALAEDIRDIGQGLYYPPNVKGWDGGRSWINSSTLLGRANLVFRLLENEKTRFATQSLQQHLQGMGVDKLESAAEWLAEHLLAVPLSEQRRAALIETASASTGPPLERLLHSMAALPEFQLC